MLVMPPLISITLSAMFFFLYRFLLDDYGLIFFAGFVAGYSTYLIIHYAVHDTPDIDYTIGYVLFSLPVSVGRLRINILCRFCRRVFYLFNHSLCCSCVEASEKCFEIFMEAS